MKARGLQRFRKTKWRWATLAVVVLGLAIFFSVLMREPRYQGQPLRSWVAKLPLTLEVRRPDGRVSYMHFESMTSTNGMRIGSDGSTMPTQAVLAIGTNGIPVLLKELEATDSKLEPFLEKAREVLSINMPIVFPRGATLRRAQALTAFRILGPNANVARKELEGLMESRKPGVREAAELILTQFSTNTHESALLGLEQSLIQGLSR